ncbi:MAG TPA: ABC transporter substrate-binding protein [Candidatus Scatomorpha merdipullorum]|uniref:ABC transporter substrate-binding protein n=1 Tax=Candidatus Scatomorpha merdipullorum TaxID=2840927 RepID=A0A9D1FCU9_9FIRM|nr:ABC transporter substrate-binding protein [Candidatus Scatomorpha merdipullorum]
MSHSKAKKPIRALCLALALLTLSACGGSEAAPEESALLGMPGEELGIGEAADAVFSLNYNSQASLNPYATDDTDNLLISQLVYDNVFELDDDFNLTSRILEDWEVSANGAYWTFTVKEDIPMHDGSELTAYDVAYSISLARRTDRYSGRFQCMYGASASDERTFHISTTKAHRLIPYLLTVPVVKDGSASQTRPAGTGPYMYVEDADYIEAFPGYGSSVPVERIYMKEYTGAENIIAAFENSYIDLVVNDASGASNIGYGGNTETRWYNTLNMHYIGFNMESDMVSNPSVRYALSLAVDRQTAADSYMKDGATAAALPISPASPLYNGELASQLNYNLSLCAQVLEGAGVSDMDNDGRLEQLYASQLRDFELDLIVCSQSSGKGDVCNRFAEDMDSLGVTVNVRELSWSDYLSALHGDDLDGDGQPDVHFDMYYAEVKLGADFDLTALLTEEGSLNYGGITDSSYATYINDYLAADDLTRSSESYELLRYIAANAPIIPVCFERHEVITHRNVITGMNVTANNVFFNISDWTITFSDEDREEK